MEDGVLIIDKPSGWTSNDVVQKVKKLINAKRVGHAGTLDPLATGVLPLCVNGATKRACDLLGLDKKYRALFKLGEATDTGDKDGKVVKSCRVPASLNIKTFRGSLGPFTGEIDQRVPLYSAVKWKGRPLYHWARRGVSVPRPIRKVFVSRFEAVSCDLPCVGFEITCSKGTYVRALLNDWALSIGLVGHVVELERVRLGPFSLEDAMTVSAVEKCFQEGLWEARKSWVSLDRLDEYLSTNNFTTIY